MIDHLAVVRRSTTNPDEYQFKDYMAEQRPTVETELFQFQASNGGRNGWLLSISIEERELYSLDIPNEVLQHFPRTLGMPAVRDRIKAVLPLVFAGQTDGDEFRVLDHAVGAR